jgi:hypothetical protein
MGKIIQVILKDGDMLLFSEILQRIKTVTLTISNTRSIVIKKAFLIIIMIICGLSTFGSSIYLTLCPFYLKYLHNHLHHNHLHHPHPYQRPKYMPIE